LSTLVPIMLSILIPTLNLTYPLIYLLPALGFLGSKSGMSHGRFKKLGGGFYPPRAMGLSSW
ncbi:hypothetical protein NL676_030263, partial [Syzygium grande]